MNQLYRLVTRGLPYLGAAFPLVDVTAQQLTTVPKPFVTPRRGHAMVLDTARDRVVMFGGSYDTLGTLAENDLWEWDGWDWTRITPQVLPVPAARTGHAMAYDRDRRRVVVFGGQDAVGGSMGDTWEWDGVAWSRAVGTTAPAARFGHTIAYDLSSKRVILFGGWLSPGVAAGDTWAWDGSGWTRLAPSASPSPRGDHAMVATSLPRRPIMLVGGNVGGLSTGDTWTWDGADWRPSPASVPPVESHALWCCGGSSGGGAVLLLFGGESAGAVNANVWGFQADRWTPWSGSGPTPRSDHAIASDPWTFGALLFGGGAPLLLASDTTWNVAAQYGGAVRWSSLPVATAPRGMGSMAYDAWLGRVILVATGFGTPDDETWEWDGARWRRIATPFVPGAGSAMTFSSKLGRVVAAGGDGALWDWDGSYWVPRSTRLSGFSNPVLCDDPLRGVIVGLGTDTRAATSVTAEWNGVSWTRRSPSVQPPPRSFSATAYDYNSRRVILFGGSAGTNYLGDTWAWDGVDWKQLSPTSNPPGRRRHAMYWDGRLQRVVLAGGHVLGSSQRDVWLWDGSGWSPANVFLPTGGAVAMAFDSARGVALGYSGGQVFGLSVETSWVLGAVGRAGVGTLGSGCGSSSSACRLGAYGSPVIGNNRFAVDVIDAPRQTSGILLFSPRKVLLQVGACVLFVDPTLMQHVPFGSGTWGTASVRLPIPTSPSLVGARLYAQALLAEPGGAFFGFALSSALQLTLGE